MTEIWDLLDKDGKKIGVSWPRSEFDKIPDGNYFPCVEVWVKIGDKLLITQRHPHKTEGLKYDCPGGAVLSGESICDGALRELYEEVGVKAGSDSLKLMGTCIRGHAYAFSFLLTLDELPNITLQPAEVVSYKLVDRVEFEAMADDVTDGTKARYLLYKDEIF